MELLVAKILSGLVLWILSLCFGLMIPYLLWKSRAGNQEPSHQSQQVLETESLISVEENLTNYHTISSQDEGVGSLESIKINFKRLHESILKYDLTSFINCLCGGLFLGICLLELLPEARESVQAILTDLNVKTSLPVAEFFVSIGLLLVMLIEQFVNFLYKRRRASRSSSYNAVSETTSTSNGCPLSVGQNGIDSQSQTSAEIESYTVNCEGVESTSATEATRSIVLIALLSVHSVFEGLALGLEALVSHLIQLLIAISVHKSLIAFSLGIKLFETFTPNRVTIAVASALIFCTASPLGCAIGILMTLSNNTTNENLTDVTTIDPNVTSPITTAVTVHVTATMFATAIMECLATGTFLYVTFIEVIPLEFSHANDDHKVDSTARCPRKVPINSSLKLLALLLGFATVTGLQFI